MCTFAEFWWIFSIIGVISLFATALAPALRNATKAGLIPYAVFLVCIVALVISAGTKNDPRCKELEYQTMLDKRAGLVQECPDRTAPGCQIKWIRYQQDSLSQYLRVLQ